MEEHASSYVALLDPWYPAYLLKLIHGDRRAVVGWLALCDRKSLAGLLMMWPVVLSLLRSGRLASGRGRQKTPEPSPCGLMHLAFAGPGQAIG